MEVLTYEKLQSYSDRVPFDEQRRWQPPQAVRALLAFEPEADQSFEISVADCDVADLSDTSSVEFLSLGEHKTVSAKWLRKHYNKVGKLLHASMATPSAPIDVKANSKYLSSVMLDLDEVLTSAISGSAFPVYAFPCKLCARTVARNSEAMRAGELAICFNPECRTEYKFSVRSKGASSIDPIRYFIKCRQCSVEIDVLPFRLAPGYKFKCGACGEEHCVTGQTWLFEASHKC
jgi:hypothetical protein